MIIAIPSMGRANVTSQVTIRSFRGLKQQPILCVPENEVRRYQLELHEGADIVGVPSSIKQISATREWILFELSKQRKDSHVLMLDDDMDFCYRPDMADPKLETIKDGGRIEQMLRMLEGWLDEGFVHVGLSARQGNNHFPSKRDIDEKGGIRSYRDGDRMMNAYAYDVKRLRKLNVDVSRNQVMHDFDLTLQLLRLGLPNRVSYRFCWNQRGSGKKGGCSTYRNAEMQATSARQLKADHDKFVTLKVKKSKSNWEGMEERLDVIVQWQKALGSAK